MKVIKTVRECRHDQFDEHSACFSCHKSCKECNKYNECLGCTENYEFNNITRLCDWKECPNGQYFSIPSDCCKNCSTSCNSDCAYQPHCFQCPSDKFLNLDDMECVDSCDESSQVQITDPQLSSIPLCRSFTYYVDPISSSPVELGTKIHPYKELNSVFVEILNFHSNSERTITVLVQEGATVYADSPTYIVNMTGVIIETYSSFMDTSGFAKMVGIYNQSKIVSPPAITRFNILNSINLEKDKQIFDHEGFDPDELSDLKVGNAVFRPYHSGLTVKNFRIVTDYDDITTSHALISPLRVDSKAIAFINVDFKCQGTILYAFTTGFNWHMENVSYETQNLFRLSLMSQKCGESRSYLNTKTYFKNVTSYNSGDKPPELHIEQSNSRNVIIGDLHFEDVYIDSYVGYPIGIIQNLFHISHENCLSEKKRLYNFTNFEITTSRNEKNPEMDGSASFIIMPNYEGEVDSGEIHMSNITCSNDHFKRYSCIMAYMASSSLVLDNLMIFNTKGTVLETTTRFATIKNIQFKDGLTKDTAALSIDGLFSVNIENVQILNSKSQNSESMHYFYFNRFFCRMNVRNVTIDNFETAATSGLLFFDGTFYSSLTVRDISVKNTVMSENSAIMSYNSHRRVKFSSIHVVNTTVKEESIGVSSLISSFYYSLTNTYNSQQELSDFFIEQSSISMLSFSYPIYNSTTVKSLVVTKVTYINSYFTRATEIVKFYDLASLEEYTIELNDFKFFNLSARSSSYLIHLQQQSSSPLVIRNIEASEISSMGITIESYDTNNVHNFTLVKIDNITAFNIDGNLRSLLNINKGARVSIINSTFFNISNIGGGPVISAGKEQAIVEIFDSKFYNNTSVEGGVFMTESGSTIKCHSCSFTHNFAVDSGVIKVNNNGIFEFYDSEFYDNTAVMSSVSTIFSTHFHNVLNNCTFSRNILIGASKVFSEVIPNVIRYQNLKDYLQNNQYLFEIKSIPSCIRVEFSSLKIENNVKSINQNFFLRSDVGVVYIENLLVADTPSMDFNIIMSESELYISNITIKNITFASEYSSVLYMTTSICSLKDIHFENSSINLMLVTSSTVNINGLIANNITGEHIAIIAATLIEKEATSKDNVKVTSFLKNINVSNSADGSSEIITISRSYFKEFSDIKLSNCLKKFINLKSITIDFASNWTITKNIGGLILEDSHIREFTNSIFSNCGSQNILDGGAILMKSSNVLITNSIFTGNKAQRGGAISILCKQKSTCSVALRNNTFIDNGASSKGGAIYYNRNRPEMSGLVYINNSAAYGPNIGSYPIKIVQRGSTNNKIYITDLGSGLEYKGSLEFDLIDYDSQITNLESSATIKITVVEANSSVIGNDFGRLQNGSANISGVTFRSYAGNHNISYNLISKSINTEIIKSVFSDSQEEYKSEITVNFRHCKSGEILNSDKQCQECAYGTYTLNWNETECHSCMDDATCVGKDIIEVDSGYWRKSKNATEIIKCTNPDACKGGYDSQSLFPVKCTTGYKGYLCSRCEITEDGKYEPLPNFQCSKCPNKITNSVKVFLFSVFTLVFLGVIIFINMNKKKDNQMSILFRIFTNYLQLMSAAMSYNVNVPGNFKGIFSQFDELFLHANHISYDCFIEHHEIRLFAPSILLFKLILYLCLPIALILIISGCLVAIRFIMKAIKSDRTYELCRAIVLSIICIVFLMHPKLTMESLSAFRCTQVDTNDYRMTLHMEYECYSTDHIFWLMLVGVPIFVIYVLALPIVAFIILTKYKHKLNDWKLQKYFLILYQGLKPERYYWEFVNTLRKLSILAINSLLISVSINYKLMLSVVVMIAFIRIQNALKPYKRIENNEIELLAIITGTVTMFCCIIFSLKDEGYPVFYIVMTILVFILNAYFLIQFMYLLLLSLECKNEYYKCLTKVFSKILCKSSPSTTSPPNPHPSHPISPTRPKPLSKKPNSKNPFHRNPHLKRIPLNKPARAAQRQESISSDSSRHKTHFGMKRKKNPLSSTSRLPLFPTPKAVRSIRHQNSPIHNEH